MVEILGRISIAPQLCGLPINRAELDITQRELLGGIEPAVEVFRVNDRIAKEQRHWTSERLLAFCVEAGRDAATLGLL